MFYFTLTNFLLLSAYLNLSVAGNETAKSFLRSAGDFLFSTYFPLICPSTLPLQLSLSHLLLNVSLRISRAVSER